MLRDAASSSPSIWPHGQIGRLPHSAARPFGHSDQLLAAATTREKGKDWDRSSTTRSASFYRSRCTIITSKLPLAPPARRRRDIVAATSYWNIIGIFPLHLLFILYFLFITYPRASTTTFIGSASTKPSAPPTNQPEIYNFIACSGSPSIKPAATPIQPEEPAGERTTIAAHQPSPQSPVALPNLLRFDQHLDRR
ncbi:hypothetical protein Dimus_018623 [Dionaea muscipula]